jgi:hypothetical protein
VDIGGGSLGGLRDKERLNTSSCIYKYIMSKLEKMKMEMQDIWDASRPNIHKNKKKYSRKGKNKKDWDTYDDFHPDFPL